MILTNALLIVGFSLIANFTNVVPVPDNEVPKSVEDLREFFIGTPHSPIDQGVALSHMAPDAYFVGWNTRTGEQLLVFRGKVKKHWEALAKNLERILIEEIKVPKECIATYTPRAASDPPEFGSESLKRVSVDWTDKRDRENFGFGAEFDVETGEIRSIGFRDPTIIEALRKAQSKAK